MEEQEIIDVWRYYNGNTFQFTWKRINLYQLFERLDYILISAPLSQLTNEVRIDPAFKTP